MIDFRIKKLFLDSPGVMNAVEKATRRALMRIGGFIRTTARRSIRSGGKKHKVSDPGTPPRSHTGLLKDNIFFGYDAASNSVVIGPVLIGSKSKVASGTVPQVLEEGGTAIVKYRKFATRNGKVGLESRERPITVAARPYMGPARDLALPRLPAMWANSITR